MRVTFGYLKVDIALQGVCTLYLFAALQGVCTLYLFADGVGEMIKFLIDDYQAVWTFHF
jgi:hypothetical protein